MYLIHKFYNISTVYCYLNSHTILRQEWAVSRARVVFMRRLTGPWTPVLNW